MTWLATLLSLITGIFRSRTSLQIENLALRHQLGIYHRTCRRPRIRPRHSIFWSRLSQTRSCVDSFAGSSGPDGILGSPHGVAGSKEVGR